MKKLIALFLAGMMLFSCAALAEESTVTAAEAEANENQKVLDYSVVMDKLPDGVTMTTEVIDHVTYVSFLPENGNGVTYMVSVAYDENYPDVTLNAELTAEQMEKAREALIVGYNEPVVELLETAFGTKVFAIAETDADSWYAELVTIYKGYVINMFYYSNQELTMADRDIAMQILSDMWIVD